MTAAPNASATSTIPGSGAMSPSMLNTPSVTTRISRYGAPAPSRPGSVASARTSRSESMSACRNTFRGAFDSRMPSMMLAWLSSSETIRSVSPVIVGMTPVLAVKPDWKVSTASVCLNAASSASSASWSVIVPAIVRTAPEPAPYRSTASIAARFMRGWCDSPR